MFNIDKISGGIFLGVYAALVVVGAFCLYQGFMLLLTPNHMMKIDSYGLAILCMGYAFCIGLIAYNKFKFSVHLSGAKNDE